jgi:hypothetical protein
MIPASETGGLAWRKSSRSAGAGACVEVAEVPGGVAVRDSKDPDGPTLRFAEQSWRAFVGAVRAGSFDPPRG